jgi:hypothetical protein
MTELNVVALLIEHVLYCRHSDITLPRAPSLKPGRLSPSSRWRQSQSPAPGLGEKY